MQATLCCLSLFVISAATGGLDNNARHTGSRTLKRSSSYFELSGQLASPGDENINLKLSFLYPLPTVEWGCSTENSNNNSQKDESGEVIQINLGLDQTKVTLPRLSRN